MKSITETLSAIQAELHAPKNQTNKFGGYKYRSCEDILEALKPLLKKHKAAVTINDHIEHIDGRFYIMAIATFWSGAETIAVSALAREADQKKGMDPAQLTGATSSYARKYALNGLFCIDDNKDPDATNKHEETVARKPAKPTPGVTDEPEPEGEHNDGYAESVSYFEGVKKSLGAMCERNGWTKKGVNDFIKANNDGKTLTAFKNDDAALARILADVKNGYKPE